MQVDSGMARFGLFPGRGVDAPARDAGPVGDAIPAAFGGRDRRTDREPAPCA